MIVPVGAKGGFVVKRPPCDRAALADEVVACYRTFVRGLLDLTDNLLGGKVVPRPTSSGTTATIRLVVAADKGTAAFSDIANEISAEYGFWLGDAFASGGSSGYDHKRMGITARGAFESVKRHFRQLGINAETTEIAAAGIGDMSGDVFGNGMLLFHLKLVGAFDHRHILLDPDPDPAAAAASGNGSSGCRARVGATTTRRSSPRGAVSSAQRQGHPVVPRGPGTVGDRTRPPRPTR